MCGITGIVGFNDKQLVYSMTRSLQHRGPDEYGYFFDDNIGLGNRRLSIIDLSTGKQPIHNEDQSVWITFNGEIFNYKKIRSKLETLGHKFYTNSDTEVIVHAYEVWEDFASRLSGQFAFALYDSKKKKLILARDKIGVKPLYYALLDGKLLFASEIKAILKHKELKREINYDALSDYLTFRYIPNNINLIKNIYKLEPATMLVYQNNTIEKIKYWDIPSSSVHESEDSIIKKLRYMLEESVSSQLISDVPIGVYLSGGIDSSTVAAIMSKFSKEQIRTFSVGFEVDNRYDDFNETKYARLIADKYNTDHKEITIGSEILKILPEIIYHLDNPIAFETTLPLYHLSKLARQKNVKVILTGDGGDELFFGYHRYYDMFLRSRIRKLIPFKNSLNSILRSEPESRFVKAIKYVSSDDSSSYLKGLTLFNEYEKQSMLTSNAKDKIKDISSISSVSGLMIKDSNMIYRMRYADMQHWIPDLTLSLTDNMSMANSVEARVPLLDEHLVSFAFSMPQNMLASGSSRELTKPLFKKAVKDLIPEQLLNRKKHGFNIPLKAWQDKGVKDIAAKLFESEDVTAFFNKDYLGKLHASLSSSQSGGSLRMLKAYSITLFLLWKMLYIDNISHKKLIASIS